MVIHDLLSDLLGTPCMSDSIHAFPCYLSLSVVKNLNENVRTLQVQGVCIYLYIFDSVVLSAICWRDLMHNLYTAAIDEYSAIINALCVITSACLHLFGCVVLAAFSWKDLALLLNLITVQFYCRKTKQKTGQWEGLIGNKA